MRSSSSAAALLFVVIAVGPPSVAPRGAAPHPQPRAVARPLVFEANAGQADPRVRFLARGAGATALLTDDAAVLPLPRGPLAIRAVGARTPPDVAAEAELPGRANYLLGRDPAKWHTGVPTFARVRYRDVYPGIDLVWRGTASMLEYDFVVAPGADPSQIEVAFDGADRVETDGRDLAITARGTVVRQWGPLVYQEVGDERHEVEGGYLLDGNRVRFAVGDHDPARPLFIDPVVYGTYLGGATEISSFELVYSMTRDAAGNTYLAGDTTSADFPLASAADGTYGGAGGFARGDAFVAKVDPTGTTLLFSTYLGGSDDDEGYGIGADASGVYVAGETYSTGFPTTTGALQETSSGGGRGFVTKLAPTGASLVWSTYVGGGSISSLFDMALDGSGHVFAVGGAYSSFPTTAGAYQSSNLGDEDIVALELDPDGTSFLWSTYVGGGGFDRGTTIAIDGSGNAYVSGYTNSANFPTSSAAHGSFAGTFDATVFRLAAGGGALTWSTYMGGAGDDQGVEIKLDSLGNVYAGGLTSSGDFPVASAVQGTSGGGSDGFVAKFSPAGAVLWATYLGGIGDDVVHALAIDASDRPVVAGYTTSTDFPLAGAPRTSPVGRDAFITTIDAAGTTLVSSTYVGGNGDDQAFDVVLGADGTPYVAGSTTSTDLPTTAGAPQTNIAGTFDAFLATAPPPTAIASFFLPKKVIARVNAKTATRSTLVANGIFDTGPAVPQFASAATLDVGGLHFDIPGLTAAGKGFTFTGNGVRFSVIPNPYGSSRARFTTKYVGDFTGKVALNGPLGLHFTNAIADGGGTVTLGRGVFGLGKVRGSLVEPLLFVARARANFKGAGRDALSVIVGLASAGAVPASAADVTIGFGPGVDVTIPGASFARKGATKDVFSGNVGGITKVTVDYARDQISIAGKALTLGSFAQGGNAVTITVGLGSNVRSVAVRMGRIGNTMKY